MRWLMALGATLVAFACGGSSVSEGGNDDDQGGSGETSTGGSGTGEGGSGTGRGGSGATAASGAGGSVAVGGATAMGGASVTGGFGATGRGGGSSGAGPTNPPGPVMCGGDVCEPPLFCCVGNSRCYDPDAEPDACPVPDPDPGWDERPCGSSAHCAEGEYCQPRQSSTCQGPGFCHSRSNCGFSSFAVCACDGNSYQDIGAACHAGTYPSIFFGGACGDTIDANQGEAPPRWVTLCGNDAHCANGERCCPLTMICYPEADPGRCQVPPEGTSTPCTADDQCYPDYEFCFGEGCEGPGGCAQRENEECGVRLEPVCGCDGVTYTSAPCAMRGGTRVASDGECE